MYILLKNIAILLIYLFTRCIIVGKNNIPDRGALLIVANHLSVADPVIIGAKLGRRVTFMAKEELFKNWFISYFIRQFGAFPVYRGRPNLDAVRQANTILGKGQALGMFPEGKRSSNSTLSPALQGSALIAYHNDSLIIPIGIVGSERIHGYSWIWHRPTVTVNIGQPFYLTNSEKRLNKEQLEEFTDVIMENIAKLIPETNRGEYAHGKAG